MVISAKHTDIKVALSKFDELDENQKERVLNEVEEFIYLRATEIFREMRKLEKLDERRMQDIVKATVVQLQGEIKSKWPLAINVGAAALMIISGVFGFNQGVQSPYAFFSEKLSGAASIGGKIAENSSNAQQQGTMLVKSITEQREQASKEAARSSDDRLKEITNEHSRRISTNHDAMSAFGR